MPKAPRRRVLVVAAAVLLVGGVIAVGLIAGARQEAPEVAIAEGPPVPALSGTDPVTGAAIAVRDFRGRPLVINVWASWCTGCRAEAPDIKRFTETHPQVGFLGIDVTDTPAAARDFVARYGWTHPSIADPQGRLAARLGLRGLPTTVFVRADGTIAGEALGEVTYEQLVETAAAIGA
jgi:thiol-disulfide isomerase/thioredoxin